MSIEVKKNSQISQDSDYILKPINEEEVSLIVKDLYDKNLPTEIVGLNSKNFIGNKLQCAKPKGSWPLQSKWICNRAPDSFFKYWAWINQST